MCVIESVEDNEIVSIYKAEKKIGEPGLFIGNILIEERLDHCSNELPWISTPSVVSSVISKRGIADAFNIPQSPENVLHSAGITEIHFFLYKNFFS